MLEAADSSSLKAKQARAKPPTDKNHDRQKKQAEGEKGDALELQTEEVDPGYPPDPEGPAEEGDIEKNGLHDKVDTDGGNGKEIFPDPKTREPKQQSHDTANKDHKRKPGPKRQARLGGQESCSVSSYPEKGCMS